MTFDARTAEPGSRWPKDHVFSIKDASAVLDVPPANVEKWFDRGQIRGYREVGSNERRIPIQWLRRFMIDGGYDMTRLDIIRAAEPGPAQGEPKAYSSVPAMLDDIAPEMANEVRDNIINRQREAVHELEETVGKLESEANRLRSDLASRDETIERLEGERDRLHRDTITGFAGLKVSTPEEGFLKAPHCVSWCFHTLERSIKELQSDNARLREACTRENDEICQTLGKVLGYPWFKDDQKNFPGSTEEHGVCVGEHVAASIAMQAARKITDLTADLSAARERVTVLEGALVAIRKDCTGDDGYYTDGPGPATIVHGVLRKVKAALSGSVEDA